MRTRPLIAIVGRTNVGKSSLFNRLVGQRLAVVHDTAGVTRDRVYASVSLYDRPVLLVDTGGLAGDKDELFTKVRYQAIAALQEADLLIFVVDAQEGLVSLDHDVAEVVRRAGKPVVFVANKAESRSADLESFLDLGFGEPLPVSAIHALGHNEVIERVLEALPPVEDEGKEEVDDALAVAVIGRPNAGKSSVVNYLAGVERSIVSETPGTTRDAVDTVIERDGRRYRIVDTAGMSRRFKRAGGLEYYSALRSLRAIERADVVVLVMDAAEGPSTQDVKLAGEAEDMGRGLVLCAHKWDLVLNRATADEHLGERERQRHERLLQGDYERVLRAKFPFVPHAPLLFTSVVSGVGMNRILPTATRVGDATRLRVETARVNRAVYKAMARHAPPAKHGRPFRILYATQVSVRPPTIVMFVNDPDLVDGAYQRYLANSLREELYAPGVPLRLRFRQRRGRED